MNKRVTFALVVIGILAVAALITVISNTQKDSVMEVTVTDRKEASLKEILNSKPDVDMSQSDYSVDGGYDDAVIKVFEIGDYYTVDQLETYTDPGTGYTVYIVLADDKDLYYLTVVGPKVYINEGDYEYYKQMT